MLKYLICEVEVVRIWPRLLLQSSSWCFFFHLTSIAYKCVPKGSAQRFRICLSQFRKGKPYAVFIPASAMHGRVTIDNKKSMLID